MSDDFKVSNVRADNGKLIVSVVSLENEQIIDAIASLVEEVKYRGIKVPALEKIGEAAVEKYKASLKPVAPPPIVLEVLEMALVETGRMIQAIKAVRQRLGCGLKDAKDACDHYKVEWERKTGKRW